MRGKLFTIAIIALFLAVPGVTRAASYLDNFEGGSGGTFPSGWVSNNQNGYDVSTDQAFSPTHSYKTAATFSEDSEGISFASNTQGHMHAKVWCHLDPGATNTGCVDIGVSFGTGGSYDGVFLGISFDPKNASTTVRGITQGFQSWPSTGNILWPGSYTNDAWNDVDIYWRTVSTIVEVRVILNGTFDTGFITTGESTGITALMIASYGSNGGNTPLGYIDDVAVQTDADSPAPPAEANPGCNGFATQICSFTPANNSTTTSPVNFSLHAYINEEDLGSIIGVKITLHNIDQNVLLLGFLSPSDIYLFEGNATTSGHFNFATSTPIGDGNYRIEACLERSYFGGWILNPFANIIQGAPDCQSHQFIVGQATFIGNISQSLFSETNDFFTGLTATSSEALASTCNPLSGNFGVRECTAFLFVPDANSLNTTMKNAREGILTRVPWGYFTRAVAIFQASSTSALPTWTNTISVGSGDDMTPETVTLTFDMNDMIAGAGTLLDSIEDPHHGQTAKDIFYPIIQMVVALLVVLTIISDITKSHSHAPDGESRKTKLS